MFREALRGFEHFRFVLHKVAKRKPITERKLSAGTSQRDLGAVTDELVSIAEELRTSTVSFTKQRLLSVIETLRRMEGSTP